MRLQAHSSLHITGLHPVADAGCPFVVPGAPTGATHRHITVDGEEVQMRVDDCVFRSTRPSVPGIGDQQMQDSGADL